MNTRYIYAVKAVTDTKSYVIRLYDTRFEAETFCNDLNAQKDNGEPYLADINFFYLDRLRLHEHFKPAQRRFYGARHFFTDPDWNRILSSTPAPSDYTEDDLPF